MNRLKRYLSVLLVAFILISTVAPTALAASVFPLSTNIIQNQYFNYAELEKLSRNIDNYLSFSSDGYFILDAKALQDDNFSSNTVTFAVENYNKVNQSLASLYSESSNVPTPYGGKLNIAIDAIKTFLKNNWPKIVKKLPSAVAGLISVETLINILDAYLSISDSFEDALTNAINFILPDSLEFLTPAIVAIIMTALPLPFSDTAEIIAS